MDNEAFRALVKERSRERTTKEIAREAVEEEFSRRRKKGKKRGGDGRYSSDDSDDNDRKQKRAKQADDDDKSSLMIPSSAHRNKRKQQEQSKYRDRAKERREGHQNEEEKSAALLQGVVSAAAAEEGEMDSATLSKYLGGDEQHTHLVKGLDVLLARKLKREMKGQHDTGGEPDLERVLQEAKQRQDEEKGIVVAENRKEAEEFLKRADPATLSTSLGRDMLFYLQSSHLPKKPPSSTSVTQSPAGVAIQRSKLTFSAIGDPGDKLRSWVVPCESTQAIGEGDAGASVPATPLDGVLLLRIQQSLSSRPRVDMIDHDDKKTSKKEAASGDTDSDEDIFGDAGGYVPSGPVSKPSVDSDKKPSKGSIFSGIPGARNDQAEPLMTDSISKTVPDALAARRQVQTSLLGLSVSAYQGGYGEEMDVDFDGRFANEEEESDGKGKKKKKEETTIAAAEYGAGRRRRK